MNKVVTSIKENKKKHTYVVSFGLESFILSEDVYTDFYLYVGKELSAKEFGLLKSESKLDKAYTYAINLCGTGRYSSYEVKKKIDDKFHLENSYVVISRLKKNGFLNDEEFAKEYKEEKENQLYGSLRIIDDLIHKKMVDEKIAYSLQFENEDENAEKYAAMIEKKYERLPLESKKMKGMNALLRRGFSIPVAIVALLNYKEDKGKSIASFNRDYTNLSKRYKNKYSGLAYKKHLTDALLRRGYSIDLIREKIGEENYDND